jgi:hypothetical protein
LVGIYQRPVIYLTQEIVDLITSHQKKDETDEQFANFIGITERAYRQFRNRVNKTIAVEDLDRILTLFDCQFLLPTFSEIPQEWQEGCMQCGTFFHPLYMDDMCELCFYLEPVGLSREILVMQEWGTPEHVLSVMKESILSTRDLS